MRNNSNNGNNSNNERGNKQRVAMSSMVCLVHLRDSNKRRVPCIAGRERGAGDGDGGGRLGVTTKQGKNI